MSYPCDSYDLLLPRTVFLLLLLLDLLHFLVAVLLDRLGFDLCLDALALPWEEYLHHHCALERLLEAALPVSSSSAIKKQLRVVRYAHRTSAAAAAAACEGGEEEESASICAICLRGLEGHKVRELCNCRHAFHVACLDAWVDGGHATCPLCRALLLPTAWNGERLCPAPGVDLPGCV